MIRSALRTWQHMIHHESIAGDPLWSTAVLTPLCRPLPNRWPIHRHGSGVLERLALGGEPAGVRQGQALRFAAKLEKFLALRCPQFSLRVLGHQFMQPLLLRSGKLLLALGWRFKDEQVVERDFKRIPQGPEDLDFNAVDRLGL